MLTTSPAEQCMFYDGSLSWDASPARGDALTLDSTVTVAADPTASAHHAHHHHHHQPGPSAQQPTASHSTTTANASHIPLGTITSLSSPITPMGVPSVSPVSAVPAVNSTMLQGTIPTTGLGLALPPSQQYGSATTAEHMARLVEISLGSIEATGLTMGVVMAGSVDGRLASIPDASPGPVAAPRTHSLQRTPVAPNTCTQAQADGVGSNAPHNAYAVPLAGEALDDSSQQLGGAIADTLWPGWPPRLPNPAMLDHL